LVRTDIAEIVGLAKSLGFWVQLNSNLNLYSRNEALFDNVALVYTSLDGTEEHHLESRGDNSLKGTIDAIRSLRGRGIPVIAICVVDTHNLDDADHLLAQAAELDIHIHFQPRCLVTDLFRGEYAADLDNQKLRAFWRRLGELRGSGVRLASTGLYLQHLANWDDFRQLDVPAREMRCAAGTGFLYVDPLGNAYPCAYTKGRVAPINLLREDWRVPSRDEMPCNDCAAGPLVEFNVLFRNPLRASIDLAANHASIGRRH
jgi:MoaA/NifB/PqqE/SkfB family radical SAM enzyme